MFPVINSVYAKKKKKTTKKDLLSECLENILPSLLTFWNSYLDYKFLETSYIGKEYTAVQALPSVVLDSFAS